MKLQAIDSPAAWHVDDMQQRERWTFTLNDADARQLAKSVRSAYAPDRELFDYHRDEFDFGNAMELVSMAALHAREGCGLALVKGLPRDLLDPDEFKLLNWAIGLHLGVARPQGKMSQYISEVKADGMNYRSAAGRGYNSNAALDFHTDGCDLVALACYNKARSGGQSMVSSSVSTWNALVNERPDLAQVATDMFYFGRNTEEAPGEEAFYGQPLFDVADGRLFGKWNRNRIRTAQGLAGVPALTTAQQQCGDLIDEILRRPENMLTMWLEPGDLQLMNNHVMLHSRTHFEDYDAPEKKRLLYRVWLATPDSVRLPATWWPFFRSIEPGTVRGGIRGHHHNSRCRAFEKSQAELLGMGLR
ncbi:MAG: TauD/TfdA family dioxygenase [Burkholderiaceae bacterium]